MGVLTFESISVTNCYFALEVELFLANWASFTKVFSVVAAFVTKRMIWDWFGLTSSICSVGSTLFRTCF